MGRATGTEAAADLTWRGGDRLDGGQGALKPDAESLDVGARRRKLEGRDLLEAVVGKVVEVPLGAVGEDAAVALSKSVGAAAHVAVELLFGLLAHAFSAQVALDLDGGKADLDVDAAPAADLSL